MSYLDEYLNDYVPDFIPNVLVKAFKVTYFNGDTEILSTDEYTDYMEEHHEEIQTMALIYDMKLAKRLISEAVEDLLGDVE